MTQGIVSETADHVRYLTINRPERRNALDNATKDELVRACVEANADPDVWVVCITGSGDRAFCAGRDLKELDAQRASGARIASPMEETGRPTSTRWCSKPTSPPIAAINGAAIRRRL